GTDEYYGTVFDFFRTVAVDAKDFFENATTGLPKQPLRMNQFGGNLAGPIVNNKLFFFTNYEGVRQRITNINALNETLRAYARSQFNAAMQPVLAQMAPLPAGCTTIPAPVSCAVPNTDAGNGHGANLVFDPAALPLSLREDTGSFRMDYLISVMDRLSCLYIISESLNKVIIGINHAQL